MSKKSNKGKAKIKPKVSSKNKENKSNPDEVALEVPKGLKALCILSFIGFMYCLTMDADGYFTYSSVAAIENAGQASWDSLETILYNYDKNDIDVSYEGQQRLSLMYIYRSLMNIVAMVGTALMFFRVLKGYYIYAVAQFLYIFIPIYMFGISSLAIFSQGAILIPLIYVGLFSTQTKHMIR
ncbi:MAG: hypothetical protein ACI8Q1_000912 [Parvicella sp.]|jgi:hypothetical protein